MGSAETLFDEFDGVAGFLRLFIETNQHLSEVINDTSTFEVLAELFLLLFGGLDTHVILKIITIAGQTISFISLHY